MKKSIVIYGTRYGSTKIYADYIAKALGASCISYSDLKADTLRAYDVIVFGGGIYAGSVKGSKEILKYTDELRNKTFVLFTVGMSDPKNPQDVNTRMDGVNKIFTPDRVANINVYHLQGDILYSKMSFLHRMMMKMFVKMMAKDKMQQGNVMILTYGQDTHFLDVSTCEPLITYTKHYMEKFYESA